MLPIGDVRRGYPLSSKAWECTKGRLVFVDITGGLEG